MSQSTEDAKMYQSLPEQETSTKVLQQVPLYLFFSGKDGVGKSCIACAAALKIAESGHRVLLISKDRASSVAQVFSVEIGIVNG